MANRTDPDVPTETDVSPQQKRRVKRDAKVSGVAGEGRTWEIVERFQDRPFVSFLGHKAKEGFVLRLERGPMVTSELPDGQSEKCLLVGRGLLNVFRDEYPGSLTSAWIVQAGGKGERWESNLMDEVVSISFKELKEPSNAEFTNFLDREAFGEWVHEYLPHKTANQRVSFRDQVWCFRKEMQINELVVMPRGPESRIAVGKVVGPYEFDAGRERDEDARRCRPVEWLKTDLRPEDMGYDLRNLILNRLARRTVGRLKDLDATNRIRHLADPEVDPGEPQMSVRSGDEAGVIGDDGEFVEGASKMVPVLRYERDSKARQRCIDLHGTSCKVCNIDFGQTYGEFASGYIHVHHLVPVAEAARDGQYQLNPETDLVPVCPNCHAMLHHHPDNPCTIEKLKSEMRNCTRSLAGNTITSTHCL